MAIIGRILAGYTDLEFGLLSCIDTVTADFDSLFKAMFRTRGETQRLEVADALGRYKFHDLGLGGDFENAMGALHYCRKIRNQYSHCHWALHGKGFGFIDLEEVAKETARASGESQFTFRALDEHLLTQQEDFFKLTDDLLSWLQHEAEMKKGITKKNPHSKPKQAMRPLLYKP